MSIVTNGTTIPEDGDNIIYDGIAVTEVICNGTSVWKKVLITHQLTIGHDVDDLFGTIYWGLNTSLAIGSIDPPTISTSGGDIVIADFYTYGSAASSNLRIGASFAFSGVTSVTLVVGDITVNGITISISELNVIGGDAILLATYFASVGAGAVVPVTLVLNY